jgi:nickel-dependent lactate racemase
VSKASRYIVNRITQMVDKIIHITAGDFNALHKKLNAA